MVRGSFAAGFQFRDGHGGIQMVSCRGHPGADDVVCSVYSFETCKLEGR